MCLLVALSRVVPGAPLVLAGNRDERFDRRADPMTVLRDGGPRTLGGRDLVAGGTWLAVNEHGVVAGLTNKPLAGAADPAKRSRGELPLALTERPTAQEAVDHLADHHPPAAYNPAWLLVGDRHDLFAIDMTGSSATVAELPAGIHVLENRPLTEASAKADHVRDQLADAGRLTVEEVARRLAGVLADHRVPDETEPAPPGAGARTRPAALRATCVHTPEFGTRWSGIVTVGPDGDGPPVVSYTDGPPCRSPYQDDRTLWG
jgi:uncharacterized protein with NRDE domain